MGRLILAVAIALLVGFVAGIEVETRYCVSYFSGGR